MIVGFCSCYLEWRADIVPLQKHLYYPFMPTFGGPREGRSAMFNVCTIGIDVLSFQKYINYLFPPEPHDWD